MNQRKIAFAGLITAVIGVGVGLVFAKIVDSPYSTGYYRHLEQKYMVICGTGGLLAGASQEALRQLKVKRDREENSHHS